MVRNGKWVLLLACALGPATAHADPAQHAAALEEAERAVRRADLAGQRLLRVLDEARLARDVRGAACVNDKLSQVNSHGRMILDRASRLRDAAARGDDAAVRRERLVIRNLSAHLARLEREGRACIYPEPRERAGTVVVTIVDPDVPDEDPSLWTEADRRRWGRP